MPTQTTLSPTRLEPKRSTPMPAAVLTAPGKFEIQSFATPEPAANQVLIRIEGCGICGSNLAPWEGREWFKYPFQPGEPGHEGWGTVDAVGVGVTAVRPGERVAMLAYHSYAEYDMAPEEHLVRLPASLDKEPFPGEALGCAWNVFERSNIAAE